MGSGFILAAASVALLAGLVLSAWLAQAHGKAAVPASCLLFPAPLATGISAASAWAK